MFYTGAHPKLHSFPTRRSSDLRAPSAAVRTTRLTRSGPSCVRTPAVIHAVGKATSPTRTRAVPFDTGVFTSRLTSATRSEEHTSELQSRLQLVCRLLLEKKNRK